MALTEKQQQILIQVEQAAQFYPHLEITFRKMFGGGMIYNAGRPIGSLTKQGLSLKLNADDRDLLLQEPGAEPLQHDGEAPSKQYVIVPEQISAEPEQLGPWLERSVSYVLTIPVKPRKKR
ncbi:TfoX/Sxy family protein [Tengunoibacter tsumagoiensis]|uniref:TfoX N-terminal domain-containing protein n=1 Tax=Tengunoibacter tsumagoiensis TaxID=2014871 RepID=A0A402A810_9CHLR|nr:TfoX/Sxy family protein [Tengunoibacter tsumagoiensis]GCE15294.1 hypothetical protein KTT_51530 [Tengunoibacter tsumagoiensis]